MYVRNLSLVNRVRFSDSLQLNDQTSFHYKVEAITAIELHLFVTHRQRALPLKTKPRF